MCKNLVENGNLSKPLIIFNRTIQRATELEAKLPSGTSSVASSIEDAVSKADIIFTCLSDDEVMQDTMAIAVRQDVEEKLFVYCSTVHPDTTNSLAKSVEAHGAYFVACPGKFKLLCRWESIS